jgi:antitoxin VapB
MPLSIRKKETVALAREVAARTGRTVTQTIHEALEREKRVVEAGSTTPADAEARASKLRAIQTEIASWPRTGLKADKAFFDSLYDE